MSGESQPRGPRLFVAAEAPEALRAAYGVLRPGLARSVAGARWARPDGVHLTITFLGATSGSIVPRLTSALALAASSGRRFALLTGSPGLFESRGRARVLYLALDGDREAAGALRAAVEGAVEPLGFARETRRFHPHVTLARFDLRSRTAVSAGVLDETRAALAGIAYPVDALVLYESVPAAGGSRYVPRQAFPLGQGPR